jgi:hypothetical protein
MKKIVTNPTHREWCVEDQNEFLKWSRAFLAQKKKPLRTRTFTRSDGTVYEYQVRRFVAEIAVIKWLYKLGQDRLVVRLDFDDFKHEVLGSDPYPRGRRRWYWGGGWVKAGYFRGPRSYVRNVAHQPKVLSETEQARRDWREKKQFNRDRAGLWGTRSRKKWAKLYSNRSFRRHQKRCIYSENYEALGAEYADWFDPWDWD